MPRIHVQHLVKHYQVAQRRPGLLGATAGLLRRRHRTVKALDGVSFTIDDGELVGYIGPNGAGKSTTVKALAGILVPDSGSVQVVGRVPWLDRIAHVRGIGVVFGQRTQLWWDLPVIESFDLLRHIYQVDLHAYVQTRDRLVEWMGIGDTLDTPVRQLSLGQRMRCDLVAALLHRPSILFLDEPTIGLDAVAKLAVRQFILELNRRDGVTVILTTHDMDDIESLCSRVLVIAEGRILCDGTLDSLRRRVSSHRRLIVDLQHRNGRLVDADAVVVREDGSRVELSFDPQKVAPAVLIGRLAARYPVRDLFVQNPPIEEVVCRLYRDASAAGEPAGDADGGDRHHPSTEGAS